MQEGYHRRLQHFSRGAEEEQNWQAEILPDAFQFVQDREALCRRGDQECQAPVGHELCPQQPDSFVGCNGEHNPEPARSQGCAVYYSDRRVRELFQRIQGRDGEEDDQREREGLWVEVSVPRGGLGELQRRLQCRHQLQF